QPDPLREWSSISNTVRNFSSQDANLYIYAKNNSINYLDWNGLIVKPTPAMHPNEFNAELDRLRKQCCPSDQYNELVGFRSYNIGRIGKEQAGKRSEGGNPYAQTYCDGKTDDHIITDFYFPYKNAGPCVRICVLLHELVHVNTCRKDGKISEEGTEAL